MRLQFMLYVRFYLIRVADYTEQAVEGQVLIDQRLRLVALEL